MNKSACLGLVMAHGTDAYVGVGAAGKRDVQRTTNAVTAAKNTSASNLTPTND